jgi:hypothetical protein
MPPLADDVVRLRPWHGSDVSAMLDAFADPWFQRFSDWAPRTLVEAHDYLQKCSCSFAGVLGGSFAALFTAP